MKRAFLMLALLSLAFFSPQTEAQQRSDVSIIRLIASPREYHNKPVRVIGFVRIEFEGNAIYVHKDDEEHHIYKNALWLSLTDEIRHNGKEYDGKFVLVEGTFSAGNLGHRALFSGAIQNITRFQVWAESKGMTEK